MNEITIEAFSGPGDLKNWPAFHLNWLQVRAVAGVVIFRSSATLYFANAELYEEALAKKVRARALSHTNPRILCN